MLRIGVLLATTGLWAIPALADDVVISVGPGGQYQRIADAVARADADTDPIINSQFMNNGTFHPHAVYIDEAASLTVTGSLFCGQLVAHDIKSRASATTVVNSTIYDGQGDPAIGCRDGSSSFAIDVPNGGVTVISGNLIIQGPSSPNFKMVAYSEEGLIPGAANSLMVSGNTFINI